MLDPSRDICEEDIPTFSALIEAFDSEYDMRSAYSGRSNRDSSQWSVPQEEAESETESDGPWAPSAWQRPHPSHRWYERPSLNGNTAHPNASNRPFDREVTPSRIPLPESSPKKQTPYTSPEPESNNEKRHIPKELAKVLQSPEGEPRTSTGALDRAGMIQDDRKSVKGFLHFTYQGEAKFHTTPIEETFTTFAIWLRVFDRSRANFIFAFATVLVSWLLLQPWTSNLNPNIASVANMAKQFEPLLYASENIIPRSRELAEAGIAVQDLGESVRASNMSASSVIINQLDELSDSLTILSERITSFFTNFDGDMDSILITMEWAKRELQSIQRPKLGVIGVVVGNVHGGLSKIGLLDRNGSPTAIGRVANDVLGHTSQQRSKATLQRTFDYLLETLEENVANELNCADILFQLFESVDRQFHNLHRSVAKEEYSLTNRKDEFLASLWRMTIKNKIKIKKYERNLKLLKDIRASTLINKSELKRHIHVINSVKDQLGRARKNLVSPLIQSAQSKSLGIEQQLDDLTGTYGFLKGLRDGQKKRVLQQLWGESKKRITIKAVGEEEIDDWGY